MATLTGALQALEVFGRRSEFVAAGIKYSYGIEDYTEKLVAANVPCLVVLPEASERIEYGAHNLAGNRGKADFEMKHLAILAGGERPLSEVRVLQYAVADAYTAALKAQPFISDESAPAVHDHVRMVASFEKLNLSPAQLGDGLWHCVLFTLSTAIAV